MTYTFEELKKKTVAELREIAAESDHEALKGFSQLNKEHLLAAFAKALNLDTRGHHEVKGLNKAEIKAQIREFKKQRDEALSSHDHGQLKEARRKIHRLKRMIHRATV